MRPQNHLCACWILLSAAVASPSLVSAHGYKQKSIEIIHPWTPDRPIANSNDAIAGMSIKNTGKQSDRLLSARSASANRVEIVQLSAPPAKAATQFLNIEPGQELVLSPRGAHLRLVGLKKPLIAYDTLSVTLVFEKAGAVNVDVLVEEIVAQ